LDTQKLLVRESRTNVSVVSWGWEDKSSAPIQRELTGNSDEGGGPKKPHAAGDFVTNWGGGEEEGGRAL